MLRLCFASRISKGIPLVFVRECTLVSHLGMDISPLCAQENRDMYPSTRIGHHMSVRHRHEEFDRSKQTVSKQQSILVMDSYTKAVIAT